MDNGKGFFDVITKAEFDEISETVKTTGNCSRIDKVFHKGETVAVKDSKFKIKHIDFLTGIMVLKLLPVSQK